MVQTAVTAPPSGLSATSILDGVRLDWTNPAKRLFVTIEIWGSNDNDRSNASLITGVTGNSYTENLIGNYRNRYYWIRAISSDGRASAWHPTGSTSGVSGKPTIPSDNVLADPDFAQSTAFGSTLTDLDHFWNASVTDTSPGSGTASSITLLSGGGSSSSNAVKFVKGDISSTQTEGYFKAPRRFRWNKGHFDVHIRWRNNGSNTFGLFSIRMQGFNSPTDTTAQLSLTAQNDYAVTGTTWNHSTVALGPATNANALYWDFQFFWFDLSPDQVEEIEIDSVFIVRR